MTRSPVCGPLAAALLGLLAVLASAVPRANAQGDADAGVDVPAVVPFAASEIASATNDTSAALAALELSLAPSREMKAIEAALPGLEERVSEQAESPAGRLGLRELDEARQTWLATQADLEHYQSALEERAARLEEVERELEDMRARWQATRDVDPPLPDAALEQARRALRDVARTRRKVEESLARTLQVQRNVASVQLVVTGVLNRIEGAESDLRGQLTQRTRGFIYPHMPRAEDEHAFVGPRGAQASIARFVRQSGERLPFQLVLFVLLFAAGRYAAGHATGSAAPSVRRPFVTALFMTLVATRVLHPYAPAFVRDLVLLGTVGTLAGVLRTRAQRRVLAYALPFVVIDALRVLSHEASHWHRVTLLLASLAGCLPLVAVLRESRPLPTTASPDLAPLASGADEGTDWLRGRNARWLCTMALGTLLVAVGSNALGYITLAQLLSEGTLATVYLSGTLAVLAEALDAFLEVLIRTPAAVRLRSLQSRPEVVLASFQKLVHVTCWFVWGVLTLEEFRLLEPVREVLISTVEASFSVGEVTLSLGRIGTFVLALLLAYWASRFAGFLLDEDVLPRMNLGRGVAPTVSMLSRYTIIGLGIVLAVAAAGVHLSNLTFIMGALGVGIGFGLQTVVNNFVSGLILIFERPVKIGDVIEVGDQVGEVTSIGIRASTVRTYQGAEVIVPNAQLISNEVVNWTASDRSRRVDVDVGVAYGTDLRHAVNVLTEAAAGLEEALEFPAPKTVFVSFGDSAVNLSVRMWIWEHNEWLNAKTALAATVAATLQREGIEIPFPQQVVHRAPEKQPAAGPATRPQAADPAIPGDPSPGDIDDDDNGGVEPPEPPQSAS
ncbi:MAG: mechanosensitive ion channel [Sandaracinaceae bacterium]|nr:mechanosensitive ion channel [Sandaracinaceae bacterium]